MRYFEKILLAFLICACAFDVFLVCERVWHLLPKGASIDIIWRIATVCGCGLGLMAAQFILGGRSSYVGPCLAVIISCEIARNDYIFNNWSEAWVSVAFLVPIFIFMTVLVMAIDVIFIGELNKS